LWWRRWGEVIAAAVATFVGAGAVGAGARECGIARWAMFDAGLPTGARWRKRDTAVFAMLEEASALRAKGREFGAAFEAMLVSSFEFRVQSAECVGGGRRRGSVGAWSVGACFVFRVGWGNDGTNRTDMTDVVGGVWWWRGIRIRDFRFHRRRRSRWRCGGGRRSWIGGFGGGVADRDGVGTGPFPEEVVEDGPVWI
jgi:hypothetical protein